VKYANDLEPRAEKETVLMSMINRLNEVERHCGMETNVEKSKVMRISRQPSPIQIMRDKKQLQNIGYLNH
jgi:hypothetical protein